MASPSTTLKVVGVCSANVQRSPTFEAVLKYTLDTEQSDLRSYLLVSSAGLHVHQIEANDEPVPRMLEILAAASETEGIVPDELCSIVQYLQRQYFPHGRATEVGVLPSEDSDTLRRLHGIIRPRFRQHNIMLRNGALRAFGIPDKYFAQGFRQLLPEEHYDLVLVMDSSLLRSTFSLYGIDPIIDPASGNNPKSVSEIEVYGDFVGVPPLLDHFSGSLEAARRCVQYFMDTRHTALTMMESWLSGV